MNRFVLPFVVWCTSALGCGGVVANPILAAGDDSGAPGVDGDVDTFTVTIDSGVDGGIDTLVDSGTIPDTTDACADAGPPTFAGLQTIDEMTSSSLHLHWSAALGTPPIRYEVFVSKTSGGETFGAPTLTTTATDVVVSALSSNTQYFAVVRAVDCGAVHDGNAIERAASTLVDYELDVQPIFTANCAVVGCHVGASPTGGLVLADGFSHSAIVGVPSKELPAMKLVAPLDPTNSYLYQKITGHPAGGTAPMPPPSTGALLTTAQIDTINLWILQGALP